MEQLDCKTVRYDKMGGGVSFDARGGQVLVALEALEFYFERDLNEEDAIYCAVEIAPMLSRVANATPADDGKINITRGILASRDWEPLKEEDFAMDEGASHY